VSRLPKPLSIVLGIRGMKCDAKDALDYCFMVQASMCRLRLRLSSSAAWFGGIRMISSKTDDLQPAVVWCSSWSWANLRRSTNSGPIFQMVLSFHWHVTVCQICDCEADCEARVRACTRGLGRFHQGDGFAFTCNFPYLRVNYDISWRLPGAAFFIGSFDRLDPYPMMTLQVFPVAREALKNMV
jgi:hypothetical protein